MHPLAIALVGAHVLASVDGAESDAETNFTLRPETGYQWGKETFEFHDTVTDPSITGPVTLESTLTYPLDAVLLGVSASYRFERLTVVGMLRTNVTDPSGKMRDRDWITEPGEGLARTEFSFTESKTALRVIVAEYAVRVRAVDLASNKRASISGVAGFRFDSSSFEAWGAKGWQLKNDFTPVYGAIPESVLGLTYTTRYYMPFLGVRFDANIADIFSLGFEARGLSAWSTHDDDHVLRHKTGEANMHAFGYAFSLEPSIDIGKTGWGEAFLGLAGEVSVLEQSNGTLHQHFYGDDPGTKQNETGLDFSTVGGFAYQSLRYRILATLELRL